MEWTTADELCANRHRFRREGVAVMTGDREQRHPLRVESRREIYVRPAFRLGDRRRSFIDTILEKLFSAK